MVFKVGLPLSSVGGGEKDTCAYVKDMKGFCIAVVSMPDATWGENEAMARAFAHAINALKKDGDSQAAIAALERLVINDRR